MTPNMLNIIIDQTFILLKGNLALKFININAEFIEESSFSEYYHKIRYYK